ncbi:MAG: Ig-like domain-containing protein, partial [Longimicrobiales bacterium]
MSGNLAGTTQVTASFNGAEGTVTVTVAPPPVASVTIEPPGPNTTVGGSVQLQAVLRDANNNVLSGRTVAWNSLNPAVVTVDPNTGLARGVTLGAAQVTATSEGVTGTVTVSVVTAMTITTITPSPILPGGTATISGTGFSATPQGNTVTVGGIAALVTAATATSLSVTLPASMCLPTGNAVVLVNVTGGGSAQLSHPFQSNSPPFTLAIGQQAVIVPPANFCLQFAGGAAVENYAIGVQSVSDVPASLTPAVLRGIIPANASPAEPVVSSAAARASQRSASTSGFNAARLARRERHQRAEMSIRAQEQALGFTPQRTTSDALLTTASMTVPANTRLGDTLTIRVPNRSNICQNPISIRAVVRHVGTRAFFLEDVGNPAGGFTPADYTSLGTLMDSQIWTTNNAYFGTPTDRDANARIVIVITKEINRVNNILGFVSSGDFQPGQCPASNNGEYYYGFAPDPTGIYALGVFTLDEALYEWPLLIAHEFTHIIQFGRRIETPGATSFQ